MSTRPDDEGSATTTESANGSVLLTHKIGLHARPSVKLTKLAKRFDAQIRLAISPQGPWIDAKSIARVMGARIAQDETLYFEAQGDDAHEAVTALVRLVEGDFEAG